MPMVKKTVSAFCLLAILLWIFGYCANIEDKVIVKKLDYEKIRYEDLLENSCLIYFYRNDCTYCENFLTNLLSNELEHQLDRKIEIYGFDTAQIPKEDQARIQLYTGIRGVPSLVIKDKNGSENYVVLQGESSASEILEYIQNTLQ